MLLTHFYKCIKIFFLKYIKNNFVLIQPKFNKYSQKRFSKAIEEFSGSNNKVKDQIIVLFLNKNEINS